jgi:hypothetical protein
MRAIWHIAAKDVRRVAWWWLGWWALLAVMQLWIRVQGLPLAGTALFALVWAVWVLGFFVAGLLMLEDPVPSDAAFWRTRPISRVHLLTAKLALAVMLLGVMPALLEAMFSILPATNAAREAPPAIEQRLMLPLILLGLAMGSLAKDVGTFVVYSGFVLSLGLAANAVVAAAPIGAQGGYLRHVLQQAPWWPAVSGLLILHVLTGRTRLCWCLIAAGLIVRPAIAWLA